MATTRWYGVAEAAELLRVPVAEVHRMIGAGEIDVATGPRTEVHVRRSAPVGAVPKYSAVPPPARPPEPPPEPPTDGI